MSESIVRSNGELGLVPILQRPIRSIRPSPENDRLYRPIQENDPEVVALSDSIRERGVLEPLVVTEDGYILSGHRRWTAALLAGCATVPCRTEPISHHSAEFLPTLREYNRQREKSLDEKLREEVVSASPEEAYEALVSQRARKSRVKADLMMIEGEMDRAVISPAKFPFLNAVRKVLRALAEFLPVSERKIHYSLLNDPPLKHASKPDSTYRNDKASSKALSDLVTRARIEGHIPMEWICDETRPVTVWSVYRDPSTFIAKSLDNLLSGYWRDRMQSQANHVEIVGEKMTLEGTIRPIASEYCIPYTLGRGYCSLRPRWDIVDRFKKSGKERLALILLSDFDPDGVEISQSLARSFRDDFEVEPICVKAALTTEQVRTLDLPTALEAKETSSNFRKFADRYGTDAYELEAVSPGDMQEILRRAINSVLDVKAYNHEVSREREDAGFLDTRRRQYIHVLRQLNGVGP